MASPFDNGDIVFNTEYDTGIYIAFVAINSYSTVGYISNWTWMA